MSKLGTMVKILLLTLYYKLKFSKKDRIKPEDLRGTLDTPEKVFAFYMAHIDLVERLERPNNIQEMLLKRRATIEGLPFLFTYYLKDKAPCYIIHFGKKQQELYRACLVLWKGKGMVMGKHYSEHPLDPFKIMKDYGPDYDRWVLSSPTGSTLIASYSSKREPEVIIYDPSHEQYLLQDLLTTDNLEKRGM